MAKLLYLVTESGYFFSHRYALAKAAQIQGYDVVVATTLVGQDKARLQAAGFKVCPLVRMNRTSLNPWKQLLSLIEVYSLYRTEKPDVVHHLAMKPVLYGTIAALMAGKSSIVNALTGLGYVFISPSLKAKILRWVLWHLFKLLFKGKNRILIVQNGDDFKLFSKILPPKNVTLIRGSGVDTTAFCPAEKTKDRKKLKVVLLARMLWDKGIQEAIDAVTVLKKNPFYKKLAPFEFVLAGGLDLQNPSGIPQQFIESWQELGICKWAGKVDDVADFYQKSDIVVLPSYREGLPKSLLEAAACGLPIVTTDVPGCREVVQHNKTGLLVPVKTVLPLAQALERLLKDKTLRIKLGKNARTSVVKHFSEELVIQQTLKCYQSLTPNR